tara:strand:- start:2279 stop:2548 length:270 start_codon:yes stop_codon:yes gene_type:complete
MTIQELIDKLNREIERGTDPKTIVKIFQVEREENWDDRDLIKEVFCDFEVLSSDGDNSYTSYLPIYSYSDNHELGGRCRSQHPIMGGES